MYISEPPCGDASMLQKESGTDIENKDQPNVYWTGAKPLTSDGNGLQEGICRLKSGRSDLPDEQRSNSMSCSDKILSWNKIGL